LEKEAPIQISYTNLLTLIINTDGKIRFITKPMARLLGFEIDELIGRDISLLFEASEIKKLESLVQSIDIAENLDFHDFPALILSKMSKPLELNLKIIQIKNSFLVLRNYMKLRMK